MTKEVAKSGQYVIMKNDAGDITEVIRENLGDDATLSVMDFTRVSVPTGGSTTWVIPDIDAKDGEIEAKEIVGIIVATKTTRQFWPDPFDGGGSPPQCASEDGLTGFGDPGGVCADCSNNVFGSHQDGKRKACQEKRLLFVVRENDFLPTVIVAPAGSLKGTRQYLTGLASKSKFAHGVYTKLTLEKDKNVDGIVYSKIKLVKVGDVESPDKTRGYAQSIKPFLNRAAREMSQSPMEDYGGSDFADE